MIRIPVNSVCTFIKDLFIIMASLFRMKSTKKKQNGINPDICMIFLVIESELLKRRVGSYEIFPVQDKCFRPLGSTTALDQPAVYGLFESVKKAHK